MSMLSETYLNHPTFGLLFSLCMIESKQALYTTLYANRLFFLVTTTPEGLDFTSISRSEAKIIVEQRMRALRQAGAFEDYKRLGTVHSQTFQ